MCSSFMKKFEFQKCLVEIVVPMLDQYGVVITPKNIEMKGQTVLTQYIVPHWQLRYKNESKLSLGVKKHRPILFSGDPDEGIVLTVVLRRRIVNELLTTYLPSILIMVIVYSTNFFKEFFFEAIVTVNLTSQLVLTTIFISVSGSLPKTAYVKMIDVWLIFAQLIPFTEVIEKHGKLNKFFIYFLRSFSTPLLTP